MSPRAFLLPLLLLGCGAAAPAPPSVAPPIAPPVPGVWAVCDTAYLGAALDLVRSAEREIEIVHFSYAWGDGVREIQEALGAAVRRGVRVRMILDDEPRGNARALGRLRELGVDVRLDGSKRRLHAKILLADRRRVLFGSTNLSWKSITENHETNLLIEDAAVGAVFADYAERIRANPDTDARIPSLVTPTLEIHLDRAYEAPLRSLLDSARTRVDLQMYGTRLYRDDPSSPSTALLDGLRRAVARGVRVRVILERAEGDFGERTNALNIETAEYLRAGGCEVRFDRPDVISHAKLLLVDEAATVGSMNWGYGGIRVYHEANAIVRVPSAVADLHRAFEGLWSEATP